MSHSFQIVEEKLLETEFFLEKFRNSTLLSLEARFYFSAFASAARSTTLSLQKSLKGVDGFAQWYAGIQTELKANVLASYFLKARNDIVHEGLNPLNAIPAEHLHDHLRRQMLFKSHQNVLVIPSSTSSDLKVIVDAPDACKEFMVSIAGVIFDGYSTFKTTVDPRWYFTEENFKSRGKTLADALAEMGFPSTWLEAIPAEGNPWRLLRRQQPGCVLNELFQRYVGRSIADPDGPNTEHADE